MRMYISGAVPWVASKFSAEIAAEAFQGKEERQHISARFTRQLLCKKTHGPRSSSISLSPRGNTEKSSPGGSSIKDIQRYEQRGAREVRGANESQRMKSANASQGSHIRTLKEERAEGDVDEREESPGRNHGQEAAKN